MQAGNEDLRFTNVYDKELFSLRDKAIELYINQRKEGLSFAMLIDLLVASGSRVQALLSLRGEAVDKSGGCFVVQGKGSNPLYVSPIYLRQEFVRWAGFPGYVFSELNYRQVQRILINDGIVFNRKGFESSATTKIFRLCKVREVNAVSSDIKVAKLAIGHKSIRSTAHYLANEKTVLKINRGITSRPSGEVAGLRISKNGIIYTP